MAADEFPIDDPDDEIPPANPARRRVATLTGCLFVIVVLGFIIWFAAANSDAPEERPNLFGLVVPSRPSLSLTPGSRPGILPATEGRRRSNP